MAKRERRFKLQPFQEDFFRSKARFPGYVAAWGTGKTMTMILKGMALSDMYPGNRGMIVRKTFKNLSRSTMKDFEQYTGLRIPPSTQEVLIPGTGGSSILFSHAEDKTELWDTVQNINLGWAAIEQAEEFDTAEVFDMLDGRVRRILTPRMDIQEQLVKKGLLRRTVDRFETLTWKQRERCETGIMDVLDLSVRQIFVIANTKGHNWIWRRWKYEDWEEYKLFEARSYDNEKHLPSTTLQSWERKKVTSPKIYNRFILNSWEDYDMEGAFYASLMSDALKEHRVGMDNLCEPNEDVYTFWDLGIRVSDTTSIWFAQFIGQYLHLIDYYENYGEGMNHYNNVLNEKHYNYGEHWLPFDADTRMQGVELETRADILRNLRRSRKERVRIVPRHSKMSRIEVTRGLIHKCRFDAKCRKGVEGLNHYRKKFNEIMSTDEKPVFMSEPLHDWASNPADAFGYMAWVYRYESIEGRILGYAGAVPEWIEDGGSDVGVTDLLSIR